MPSRQSEPAGDELIAEGFRLIEEAMSRVIADIDREKRALRPQLRIVDGNRE
jgi:hypothetical protein